MSQVINAICDAKMSLYVPLNVLVKEYEGKNDGKMWLVDGKMSVKWC